MASSPKKRLGELLVEAGIIDAVQLQVALARQRQWGGRIGQALIDLKMATEEQIVSTLAAKLGFERTPVEQVEWGPGLELALRLVPHGFAQQNQVLAYAADPNHISVAMADPTNVAVIDELAFRTGRHVKITIAGDREIARSIRRLYLGDKRGVEAIPLDEQDDGPVEMIGPLDPLHEHPPEAYHGRERKPAAGPPDPPPLGAPISAPAARLAAAARGLRREHDAGVKEALLEAPPEVVVEVDAEPDPFGPRVEAILEELERMGEAPVSPPELARLARFSSWLVRILAQKGLVTEEELAQAFFEAQRGSPRR